VNSEWLKSMKNFSSTLRSDVRVGFHPRNNGKISDSATHELGHWVDDLRLGVKGPFRKAPVEVRDKIRHALHGYTPKEMKASVSRYAAKNSREAFAEMFEAWNVDQNPASYAGPMREFCEAMNEARRYF
jgi:hypothetical protein